MSLLVHPVMENAEGVENGKQMELKIVSVASSRSGGPIPFTRSLRALTCGAFSAPEAHVV